MRREEMIAYLNDELKVVWEPNGKRGYYEYLEGGLHIITGVQDTGVGLNFYRWTGLVWRRYERLIYDKCKNWNYQCIFKCTKQSEVLVDFRSLVERYYVG